MIATNNVEALEKSLEEGGYTVERNEKKEYQVISQGQAKPGHETLTLTNGSR